MLGIDIRFLQEYNLNKLLVVKKGGYVMKIYDMHIHIGEGEATPSCLLERMEKSGVYGGALISACPEEATASLYKLPYKQRLQNLLEWTRDYEGRLFPVLWVHPEEKHACDIVKDAALSGVRAFKIICDTFPIYSKKSVKLLEAIEKTGKPIIFHTGILWSGTDTSKYNRPADWECLLNLNNVKFSMGHCSWPWHDECIAVYGKFLHSYLTRQSSEMFFDITPGTPEIYRRELLTKLFTVGYDVENNIMFGTDSLSNDYNPEWVGGWIARDNAIFDELGVTKEQREKIYEKNLMRFLNNESVKHRLPQINK